MCAYSLIKGAVVMRLASLLPTIFGDYLHFSFQILLYYYFARFTNL